MVKQLRNLNLLRDPIIGARDEEASLPNR